MSKSGLVTLWNRKFEIKGNDCLYPLIVRAGDVKKIGLSHMVDCFFVLGLGLMIGIMSLLVEIVKQSGKEKPFKLKFRMPKIQNGKGMLRFVQDLYDKVKNGRLYENWFDSGHKSQATKANGPGVSPLMSNYFTYSNNYNMKDNARSNEWKSTLQRQQKMYYFQKNLDLQRTLSPSNHYY